MKKIKAALGVLLGHTVVVNAYIEDGHVFNKPGIRRTHYIGNVYHADRPAAH